jgi:hypothetical protein
MRIERLCIYPKDIMIITGRSERYARKILRKLKLQLGKKPHQFISIKEFAEHFGLDENEIKKVIQE